ncbi:hypothetical protein OPT61_g419 [Boeremia exigua]|uniref:Uncharacterized protein n=1 Tax=Boeremia exigua TaxID=749465 RepID=A0ACC2IU31_9PLEO|nr:hypothetical protein OPT61_g419 [Boeremia exigua]
MDPVDFTLQLLSVIFTLLATIIAIGAIDVRWSVAAILCRRLCNKRTNWAAERRKWQEGMDVDIERLPTVHPHGPNTPPRTLSAASGATLVAPGRETRITHPHCSSICKVEDGCVESTPTSPVEESALGSMQSPSKQRQRCGLGKW